MVPNLAESQHAQIRDMILDNRPTAEIADAVGCSKRSLFTIKPSLHLYGSTKALSNSVGQPKAL
jgi:DNA invertase Pin-like site-specific DNA recombinase